MYKHKKISFKNLKVIGLDEADYFFKSEEDMDQFKTFIDAIDKENPNVQKLFFSATYPVDVMNGIKQMVPTNSIKIELPKEWLT